MRVSRLSVASCVLLLAIGTIAVDSSSNSLADIKGDAVEPSPRGSDLLTSQKGTKAAPKGTLDAPVDGKDGKPHEGPWVETAAERDRKKDKADGRTFNVADTERTGDRVAANGKAIPHSNEGVMDDPSRVGPKEGTRGTEGGMTEKTKDTKQIKDKVPETPKEARPLPHSEQEKIPGHEDIYETTDKKTGDSVLQVWSLSFLSMFMSPNALH